MKRIPSLALRLLPLPIKESLPEARRLGARAVVFQADWTGGFMRPGVLPVEELVGRTLHDFRRVLRQADLTPAAIDLADPLRGVEDLDRIYAIGVRTIEVLAALDGSKGILSLELAPAAATADSAALGALKELTQLGFNRGVRVAVRTTGGGWADGIRDAHWPDGLGVDLDLPELRRFGQPVTQVLDRYRGRILHLRCDDYELNLSPSQPKGLLLPTKLQKAEPETLTELTIFLEHAGYEGAWTLKNLPPAPLGVDPKATLTAALAKLAV